MKLSKYFCHKIKLNQCHIGKTICLSLLSITNIISNELKYAGLHISQVSIASQLHRLHLLTNSRNLLIWLLKLITDCTYLRIDIITALLINSSRRCSIYIINITIIIVIHHHRHHATSLCVAITHETIHENIHLTACLSSLQLNTMLS